MIKNKVYHFLLVLCFAFTSAAFAQDLVKDSIRVQKIIKDAGKGKKDQKLLTITDAGSVAFLSSYIDARAKAVEEMEQMLLANNDKALGRRYRKGDRSAKTQVLAILKGKDKDKISELIDEMEPDHFDKDKTVDLDADVKAALFKLINDNELERDIVQFAGYNKIEGHVPAFEARLISGKSTVSGRLFFWLGRDGKSEKAIDYFISSFGKIPVNDADQDTYWFTEGLDDFMENGTAPIKKKIIHFAIAYMEKNAITMTDLLKWGLAEQSGEFGSEFEPKTFFVQLVLKSDDPRVPSFSATTEASMSRYLKGDEKKELHDAMELNLLRFYDFPKKKAATLALQPAQDDIMDLMNAVAKDKVLLNDKEVAAYLMKLFEKAGLTKEYDAAQFATALKDMDKPVFETAVLTIKSVTLRTMVSEYYKLEKKTVAENNDYLIKNGLITTQVTQEQLNKRKTDEDIFYSDDSIYSILDLAGISYNFDVEPGVYPADHDTLLLDLTNRSAGKIRGVKAYQQSKFDDKEETSEIHLIAVYKNKAYILIPEDLGDWYDMEAFSLLLEAIAKDSGLKEKFVPVETGDQTAWYIFGEPQKVQKLVDDYKLAAELTLDEE
ncbi:hypothetical protein [Flavobacterium sp.]|uniref:hypothetical protein n=1 Tax=Flavobacterium sp. TaxID=239 RepID=UPI0040344259